MFPPSTLCARCMCSEPYNDEAAIYEIGGFDYPKQKDPNDLSIQGFA
jgi:hypothetical protein